MPDTEGASSGGFPGGEAMADALSERLRAIDSGQYRRSTERAVTLFAEFLATRRGVTDLAAVDVTDCRRYAQFLRQCARGDPPPGFDLDISASTASGPYYETVRAFLGWCVRDERLDANPAAPARATEPLPDPHGDPDRQFWDREARESVLRAVEDRARDALADADDPRSRGVRAAFRDRALVYVLALTGVRGAEVFRDPADDHRDGLRWRDVDLDDGVARVLGKTRERQTAPLPGASADRLDRWRAVLDPAADWPVFPTLHAPTLSARLREVAGDEAVDARLGEGGLLAAAHHLEVAPPALTVDGARSVMRRLCAAHGVAVDGEYLKPHGGRRGIGGAVYRESAELAQDLLRHRSLEVTYESYTDIDAAETRAAVDRVLESER